MEKGSKMNEAQHSTAEGVGSLGAEAVSDDALRLERRVARLECIRQVEQEVRAYGTLCDQGPYDGEKLMGNWAVDGIFRSDEDHYRGADSIRDFFVDLVATFTLHYFTNPCIDIDPSLEKAEARWYGLEAPVIAGHAHIAGFSHVITCRSSDGHWLWAEWQQSIGFFSLARDGWSDGMPIAEQQRSKGA